MRRSEVFRRTWPMVASIGAIALGTAIGNGWATRSSLLALAAAGALAYVLVPLPLRLAVLLAMLVGNVAYHLHLPSGSFLALLTLAVVRDGPRLLARAPKHWIVGMVLPTIGLLALRPERFGVLVVGGIWLGAYVSLAVAEVDWRLPFAAAGLAGAANAAVGVLHPQQNYTRLVSGSIVEVTRGVQEGLDPNALACLLLLGTASSVAVAATGRGLLRAVMLAATAANAVGVASTASRNAYVGLFVVAGAASVDWRRQAQTHGAAENKNRPSALLFGLATLAAIPYLGYRTLRGNNSLYRLTEFSRAASDRRAIYADWWRFLSTPVERFLSGVSPSAPPESLPRLPPHNSVLELLAYFGLVGIVLVVVGMLTTSVARPPLPYALQGGAYAMLLSSNVVGLLSGYTPWLALALILRRRRIDGAPRRWVPQPT